MRKQDEKKRVFHPVEVGRPPDIDLSRVIIVLVEPQISGNIGSTARAMKTMGLTRLRLVQPVEHLHGTEAWMMAMGSRDILDAAVVYDSLAEALEDVHLSIGTTGRQRNKGIRPLLTPRETAATTVEVATTRQVAIVFGREDFGLSREDLSLCQHWCHIPTAARQSLNLSHAVMILAYEINRAACTRPEDLPLDLATVGDRERLYERIMEVLDRIGFEPVNDHQAFVRCIRRAFGRAPLEGRDLATIYRILRQMEWYASNWGPSTPEELERLRSYRSKSSPD